MASPTELQSVPSNRRHTMVGPTNRRRSFATRRLHALSLFDAAAAAAAADQLGGN